MRAPRLFPALAAAALVSGCARTDWQAQLKAEPLYQRAENLRQAPSCADVPIEFGRSLPVPVKGGKQRLTVLFYPLAIAPGKSTVFTPLYTGGFGLGADEPAQCAKLPSTQAPQALGPAVPPGLSGSAYDQAEAKLFASLQATAAAYFSGQTTGEPGAAKDFAESFLILAEPGLRGDYYRLNPDFWEWLRVRTGRSLPKG